jgi:hypothetical protein
VEVLKKHAESDFVTHREEREKELLDLEMKL